VSGYEILALGEKIGGMKSQSNSTATTTTAARNGKIARLPLIIRRELNERLANGEPNQRLVQWLNAQPEVRECLAEFFDGRPLNEQNLSAWKRGGYRDWERYQETRARARDFLEEAEELEAEVQDFEGSSSLLDRVVDRMALALLQLFRETECAEPSAKRTQTMLEIVREVSRLRRGDHQRQRTEVVEQRWELQRDLAAQKLGEELAKKAAAASALRQAYAEGYREEYIQGAMTGRRDPAREEWIRQYFAQHAEELRALGVPDLPKEEELLAAAEACAQERKEREKRAPAPEKVNAQCKATAAAAAQKRKKANQGGSSPIKVDQGGKIFGEALAGVN
jgi:hypothetical protein